MVEAIDAKEIIDELRALRDDVTFIKKHMFDDTIMTDDEYKKFQETMKELDNKKTVKARDLKKELGL
jgi:hypothetical protein